MQVTTEAISIEVKQTGLWAMLQQAAMCRGAAPALLAPSQVALDYRSLAGQTERVAGQLRSAGIGPQDRVAVVLPNGPEMAAAFVAVGASAGCAPLNPNYPRQDFDFYLRDLNARALLVDEAAPEPAVAAARSLGIQVLTMRKLARAGEFALLAGDQDGFINWPGAEHVALLLHTSGTTSRPKLVPLSAGNLTTSAAHIARALALTPADLCLNIMPLFHIHGLMAAVLATLRAGAGVVCTDGVYANRFFDWLREFRPSWYTAVPTMHQVILAHAGDHAQIIGQTPLRFIRSSSAPLPPPVRTELEQVFGAPVVEAYGMTEASHQMTSRPLLHATCKPNSVGLAAGPEVAVIDEAGRFQPPRKTGEVVIRGPNVMRGYAANPEANAAAFTDGWFRTGDQGWLDEEGYLFLTGRLKELINRGGEKISPREIDEALLSHPAVRQALAFAVPHAQLGEEVAAAVELIPGRTADEAELRRWTGNQLASFKVPRLIQIVDSIPKGPTGKLQRIGLAQKLGIKPLDDCHLSRTPLEPRTPLEARIVSIWRDLLHATRLGVEDRFEALGGDSLLAVRMLVAVSTAEGVDVPYQRFLEEGTVAALAREIESQSDAEKGPIRVLQVRGKRPPLCCLSGHDGALLGLARLAHSFGEDQPLWAIDYSKLRPASSIDALARECVAQLRSKQRTGPYRLAGVCFGGVLAFEMARILEADAETVDFLALIDTLNPAWKAGQSYAGIARARWGQLRYKLAYHSAIMRDMPMRKRLYHLAGRTAAFLRNHGETAAARLGIDRLPIANRRLMLYHTPGGWGGNALIVRLPGKHLDAPALGWSSFIHGRIEVVDIPFHPNGALAGSDRLADILRRRLDAPLGGSTLSSTSREECS